MELQDPYERGGAKVRYQYEERITEKEYGEIRYWWGEINLQQTHNPNQNKGGEHETEKKSGTAIRCGNARSGHQMVSGLLYGEGRSYKNGDHLPKKVSFDVRGKGSPEGVIFYFGEGRPGGAGGRDVRNSASGLATWGDG